MHFGIVLGHLAALSPRPDHEGIHGSFDMIVGVGMAMGMPVGQVAFTLRQSGVVMMGVMALRMPIMGLRMAVMMRIMMERRWCVWVVLLT